MIETSRRAVVVVVAELSWAAALQPIIYCSKGVDIGHAHQVTMRKGPELSVGNTLNIVRGS